MRDPYVKFSIRPSPIGSLSLLHGIRRPLTAPYSPQQNGVAERRTILNIRWHTTPANKPSQR